MPSAHPYSAEFLAHLATTQNAYESRDLAAYLSGFSEEYCAVLLGHALREDKAALAAKIASDIERFELESMQFEVLADWYSGETGFAHLGYITRLHKREGGRSVLDQRENILVGRHIGGGRWEIISKITLKFDSRHV